jgi:hypothetical protein
VWQPSRYMRTDRQKNIKTDMRKLVVAFLIFVVKLPYTKFHKNRLVNSGVTCYRFTHKAKLIGALLPLFLANPPKIYWKGDWKLQAGSEGKESPSKYQWGQRPSSREALLNQFMLCSAKLIRRLLTLN